MQRHGLLENNLPPFQQPCLQPGKRSSQAFFQHCAYEVDLTELYTLEGTCYYHEGMEFCPVLLKMGPQIKNKIHTFYPELDTEHDYKYLLQVWDAESEKVYEKILINPIKSWSIWYDYFIFEMEAGDKDSNFIHLVQLKKANSLVKIENFMKDPEYQYFAYHKQHFYIASPQEILVFNLPDDFKERGTIEIDPRRGPIARITALNGQKIHGLFSKSNEDEFIYVAFETHDNQIDFNRLSCEMPEIGQSIENFQYQFSQEREVVPRPIKLNDKIKDFQFVVTKNTGGKQEKRAYLSNAVALREFGSVDFYSNMSLASTFEYDEGFKPPENLQKHEDDHHKKVKDIVDYSIPAREVGLSFDETYVGYGVAKNGKELARRMKNSTRGQMSIEASDILDDLNFKDVFFERIQKHCKVFSYYVFVQTFIFVAHANILSLFDVQKLQWKEDNHLVFEDDIIKVFRSQNKDKGADICVMLKNGKIQVIIQEGHNYTICDKLQLEIEGEFLQEEQDRDDNRFTFIMTKLEDDSIMLYCYFKRELIPIQDQFKDLNQTLSNDTKFVFFFAEANETRFLIQEHHQVTIFTIQAQEAELEEMNGQVKIVIEKYWTSREIQLSPFALEEAQKKSKYPLFGEFHSAISIINRDDKVKYKDQPEKEFDSKAQQYFFFFDDHHIYIFYKNPINGINYAVFYEEEVKGVFFSDDNYLYTLSYKRPEKGIPSSFRLYDIWNCIDTNSTLSYELSQVQVGCQALIDFSLKNQRFLYQQSFKNLEIVPVLHRNSIYFMGMGERSSYLSTRVIDDKFIALDGKNHLKTWSTVNGKIRSKCILQNADYSGYKIFKYKKSHETFEREWFTKTLLKSEQPIDTKTTKVDETLFFQPDELKALKNQVPFARRFDHSYHQFKLIEIVSEKEVKEIASFIYPFWKGELQQLYFSENGDYMYERLFFERAQIYKRVPKTLDSSECSWKLVKRLTNLPKEFTNGTQFPFYMSPDFQKYLDIEQKTEGYQFVIRDVLQQSIVYNIPPWIMCYKEEGLKSVINRFKWRSNTEIQIINSEGIERVFPIDNGPAPKKVMFHSIPMYQSEWCKENHYYYDKPQVDKLNIHERLKRKYQAYKAKLLMEYQSDPVDPVKVYPELFTVDYVYRQEIDEEAFDRHVIDQSFTFLHWDLVEQLAEGILQLDQINDEQLECLIYNIFPGGQTVLHMLEGDVLDKLLEKCHTLDAQQKKLNVRFHLPYVQNFEGKTPMDILNDDSDYLGMDHMLKNLTPYGADHHSREIKHLFSIFIKSRLPSLNDYLASRVIQSNYLKKIERADIKADKDLIAEGVSKASYWLSHKKDPERELLLTKGEREVRVEFIDIACLHCYDNEDSQKFFEALSECDDMRIFQQFAIQKIINYKWALTKEYTVQKLMRPYLIFMSVYLIYMNWLYQIRFEPGYDIINYVFMGVLGFFCQYFFVLEMKQLSNEGLSYLSSVWNYLDLIPPIALTIFLPLEFFGAFHYQAEAEIYKARQRMANLIGDSTTPIMVEDPTVGIRTLEGVLQAVLSLILWLKLLYFLRIYKSFGYYIRLIVDVIADMKYFLALLLLTFIAFGDSFRQISSSNSSDKDFIGGTIFTAIGYVYRMVLGDFDTNAFGAVAVGYVWILFFLCTLFNMIIMLNLLIAIISESFAAVNSVSEQASFREQADMIAENTYLIPRERQKGFCEPHKYLLCATDLQQESHGAMLFEDQVHLVMSGLSAQTDATEAKLTAHLKEAHEFSLGEVDQKTKKISKTTVEKIYEAIEAVKILKRE